MRIRLIAADTQRSYDTQLGRFTDAEAIPCHRCGICCRRWQPLLTRTEAARLAAFLGLAVEDLLAEYTRPYPLEEDAHLLNQRDGGCVFLRFEQAQAVCTVHEARPQACRDWDASLRRQECLDGLRVEQSAAGLVVPLRLYEDTSDAASFLRHLRNAGTSVME
jgi:Fe-S-cluster containining protein